MNCSLFQPPHPICSEEDINHILKQIVYSKLDKHVNDLVWNEIQKRILHRIVPAFWDAFKEKSTDEREGFERFRNAMSTLYSSLSVYKDTLNMLKRLQCPNVDAEFKTAVQGIMLARIPNNHQVLLHQFFSLSFKVFCNADSGTGKRHL